MSNLASLFSVMARSVTATCPHCEKEYALGVDGTVDRCDECLGITRAVNGYAIDEGPLTISEGEG